MIGLPLLPRKSAAALCRFYHNVRKDVYAGYVILGYFDNTIILQDCILKVDRYGRPISENLADQWPARRGIAAALINIAPCLNEESLLLPVMEFLLDNPCALKDEKNAVRNDMLQVGITLVEIHGKAHVTPLLTKFEQFLANTPKTGAYDVVRQNAIVIMGTLAKHLDSKHPKIRPIVHQLLAALSTPSEEVLYV